MPPVVQLTIFSFIDIYFPGKRGVLSLYFIFPAFCNIWMSSRKWNKLAISCIFAYFFSPSQRRLLRPKRSSNRLRPSNWEKQEASIFFFHPVIFDYFFVRTVFPFPFFDLKQKNKNDATVGHIFLQRQAPEKQKQLKSENTFTVVKLL